LRVKSCGLRWKKYKTLRMQEILKKIVTKIIKYEARIVLWRHGPKVVAITGSVGKTSTKDAIFECLRPFFYTRKSEKSYNSEIGLPLTILGLKNAWNNPFLWGWNILLGFMVLFKSKYPEWLVLEVGVDHPGDMRQVAEWLKTDVVVITRFSKVPVHVEYFATPEEVSREKSLLVGTLRKDGILILNRDDEDVFLLKENAKRRNLSFGFEESSDIKASNNEFLYDSGGSLLGTIFRADFDGSSIPIRIIGSLGAGQIYSALAALAVGSALGLNAVRISEALNAYKPPAGRMRIIQGIKDSEIIDDTYNASPVATLSALRTLGEVKTERKIAILGDMMELGRFAADEHKNIGKLVASVADIFVAVGIRMRYAADSALSNGMPDSNVLQFDTSEEAGAYIQNIIKEGDIVLVKGSQSMRMEKVVEEIMLEPDKKAELLVRQDKEWQRR
jgi:UDP-N-acetylmuramoyl-tripeptide--D-alanyl-D-alanine ligase